MVGVKAVFFVVKVNGTADAAAAKCEPKEKEFSLVVRSQSR